MRPEYEQAVDAIRYGWTSWLPYTVPALLIWPSSFLQRGTVLSFIVAWFAGWAFYVYHIDHLWEVKEQLMQTPAEERDWSSDIGKVFGKVFMIPIMLCYCSAHLLLAKLASHGYRFIAKRLK